MAKILISLLSLLAWLPVSVGNHTDYSGGFSTGSDFGGFGGGGSGGSDLGGFFFLGGGGGSLNSGAVIIFILIIAAIVAYNYFKGRNQANGQSAPFSQNAQSQTLANRNEEITEKIREHDPDFSPDRFLSWTEQVFVQLQYAWTKRDWKLARPFESEELFNMHKSQLDDYIKNGTINIMSNVCANESYMCDYSMEGKHEYLTVFMNTRYNDYIIKEDTKQVVKGDPNRTYHVRYKLKFMRAIGVKTGEFSNKSTVKCPNCGAPVDVNAAGQCAYCGTVITNGENDWVLCDMDDIGQY
jgi:hypothetical protein